MWPGVHPGAWAWSPVQEATAGDVNGSGSIDAMDAFYMLQRSVGLIELPFSGVDRIWTFSPETRTYAGLTAHQDNQDFVAILLGDPSGSWSTTDPVVPQSADDGSGNLVLMGDGTTALAALEIPAPTSPSSNHVRLLLKADPWPNNYP